MPEKDFAPIENDYAFFMAHATEAESDIVAYQRELADFLLDRTSIRMLDFGCGNGDFSAPLLNALNLPPEVLYLSLCEPVTHQLDQAAERVARFSHHSVETLEDVSSAKDQQFDLILSNHVLYYVQDLSQTIGEMRRTLQPEGKLAFAIANAENVIVAVWKAGFALINQPVPYYMSEDVQRVLAEQGFAVQKTEAKFQMRFPDSEENRMKILRFCFGHHLEGIPLPQLLGMFDPYQQDGTIVIDTYSDHLLAEVTPEG